MQETSAAINGGGVAEVVSTRVNVEEADLSQTAKRLNFDEPAPSSIAPSVEEQKEAAPEEPAKADIASVRPPPPKAAVAKPQEVEQTGQPQGGSGGSYFSRFTGMFSFGNMHQDGLQGAGAEGSNTLAGQEQRAEPQLAQREEAIAEKEPELIMSSPAEQEQAQPIQQQVEVTVAETAKVDEAR